MAKSNNIDNYEDNRDDLGRFIKGNKVRREKWTKPKTKKMLNDLIQILEKDDNRYITDNKGKKIKQKTEINTINHLLIKKKLNTAWLYDIEKKFKDDEDITDLIMLIRNILESRVWTNTSDNKINSYLGIFTLKAYHNRYEKQFIQSENKNENKNEITGDVKLNIIYPNTSSDTSSE